MVDSLRDICQIQIHWAIKALFFHFFYTFVNSVFVCKICFGLEKQHFFLQFFLVCVAVVCLFFIPAKKKRIVNVKKLLFFSQTVSLKKFPDDSGTDLFFLHEGTKVIIKSNWESGLRFKQKMELMLAGYRLILL